MTLSTPHTYTTRRPSATSFTWETFPIRKQAYLVKSDHYLGKGRGPAIEQNKGSKRY